MKALVVDDDIVSRMALVDLLQRVGSFRIVECEDGEAAWSALCDDLPPAICCCDIRMPRLSGIELLQRVKAEPNLARTPIVLVSSAADRDTVERAVRLGAAGYILKPFQSDAAANRLKTILRASWKDVAEDPAASLHRLGIAPSRLAVYCAAFRKQLDDAVHELSGDRLPADLADRLGSFHTGCLTLGLWYAASLIDWLRGEAHTPALVRKVLLEMIGAVDHQWAAAKDMR